MHVHKKSKGCKTGYGKEKPPPGVSRHVFPKNPEMKERWIKAIPRSDWTPAPCAIICSIHFQETDFVKTSTPEGKFILSLKLE